MPHYDYDKDYPFAAFITNLGKYNEGALVGEWVQFPTTAEELKKVFERIGIGAKDDFGQNYEEWFIIDYDCYVDGLYDLLGEYANLDELNYLASKLDDMSQDEYKRFQAAMKIGDHTGSIQELINLTENLDCYNVYPNIHDHDDLGRYYIEELDAIQVPEHLRNYIDYEAYGRDIALEESGQFTDLGYVRDTGRASRGSIESPLHKRNKNFWTKVQSQIWQPTLPMIWTSFSGSTTRSMPLSTRRNMRRRKKSTKI